MGNVSPLRALLALSAIVLVVGALAGAVLAGQAASGDFTVVELAPGSTSVAASDVNNAGEVVGAFVDAQGMTHGFVIDAGGLSDVSEDSGFVPSAINDRGEMAGTIDLVIDGTRRTHAALRDTTGTVRDLGTLGGPSSVALDLNEQGHVVGYSEIGNEGRERAFLFDGLQMLQIGPLGASVPRVHATSINDRGQVVGFDDRGDFGTSQAFLYENGQTTLLTAEAGAQGMFANGISDRGAVVGRVDRYYGTLITGSPIRWWGGSPQRLGPFGEANAVDCRGDAVGRYATTSGARRVATLFQGAQVVDLEQELPAGDAASAPAMNDRGQIIVNQRVGTSSRSYLLTPTTPTPECPAVAEETVELEALADTYLRSGAPHTNEGGSTLLRLQASGDNRSLVRFGEADIASAVGSRALVSATLELEITNNGNNWGATGRTINVYRLTSAWAEGNGFVDQGSPPNRGNGPGATWSCAIDSDISDQGKDCSGQTEWEMGKPNQPELHPWLEPATAGALITNGQTGTVSFSVTQDVLAFRDGTAENNGWIVKKAIEGQAGQVEFASRETGNGPRLVLRLAGSAPGEQTLATSFRPHLLFDEGEHWRPISVDAFLAEQIAGTPSHEVCFRDASDTNRDCTSVQSTADLLDYEEIPHGDDKIVLDIEGNETSGGEAADYQAPTLDGCAVPADRDCDSGPNSVIYYNRTSREVPDEGPGAKSYWDYWYFFRYNHSAYSTGCSLAILDFCFEHEGDWEGVTVVTAVEPDPTIYWVSFAGHNYEPRRYTAQALREANRFRGNHVGVYVAAGTHAAYSFPCTALQAPCTQDDGGANLPDGQHGGEEPWTRNDDGECGGSCVRPLPEVSTAPVDGPEAADWTNWTGFWGNPCSSFGCGRQYGPQSPGKQERYQTPWVVNDSTVPALRLPGTSDASAGRVAANCPSWFGSDVVALACDETELQRTIARNRFGQPGALRVVIRKTRSGSSWPGLAQVLGNPLRKGDTVRITGKARKQTPLLLRVRLAANTVAISRFKVGDLPLGTTLAVTTSGTPTEPVVRLAAPHGWSMKAASLTLPLHAPIRLSAIRTGEAVTLSFVAGGSQTALWIAGDAVGKPVKHVVATEPRALRTLVLPAPRGKLTILAATLSSSGRYSPPTSVSIK